MEQEQKPDYKHVTPCPEYGAGEAKKKYQEPTVEPIQEPRNLKRSRLEEEALELRALNGE